MAKQKKNTNNNQEENTRTEAHEMLDELGQMGYTKEQIQQAKAMNDYYLEIKKDTDMLNVTLEALAATKRVNISELNKDEMEAIQEEVEKIYYVLTILVYEGYLCLNQEK